MVAPESLGHHPLLQPRRSTSTRRSQRPLADLSGFRDPHRRRRLDRPGDPGAARRLLAAEDARHSSGARRPGAAARNLGIANGRGALPVRARCGRSTRADVSGRDGARARRRDPSVTFVSCWLRTFGDEEVGVEARTVRSADPALGGHRADRGAGPARRRSWRVGGYDTRDAGAGRRGLGSVADARRARTSRRDSSARFCSTIGAAPAR